MAKIEWDATSKRLYETGVDQVVLYLLDATGSYVSGVPWNGVTQITESPSGAEATPKYADNRKYLNLISAEEFGLKIEAYTYPAEFAECDGSIEVVPGLVLGQQSRKTFGLSYRTLLGNDVDGTDLGYKTHLVWGCLASPSEKTRQTVNDSPDAVTFSYDVTTTAINVGTIGGRTYKPVSYIGIDSTKVQPQELASFQDIIYGTAAMDAHLPLPAEILGMFTPGP